MYMSLGVQFGGMARIHTAVPPSPCHCLHPPSLLKPGDPPPRRPAPARSAFLTPGTPLPACQDHPHPPKQIGVFSQVPHHIHVALCRQKRGSGVLVCSGTFQVGGGRGWITQRLCGPWGLVRPGQVAPLSPTVCEQAPTLSNPGGTRSPPGPDSVQKPGYGKVRLFPQLLRKLFHLFVFNKLEEEKEKLFWTVDLFLLLERRTGSPPPPFLASSEVGPRWDAAIR